MSNYTDHLRDWTQQTLQRTEPTEAELAEAAERARRNKLERIMAPSAAKPLPEASEKRAGEAPSGEYASRKCVRSQFKDIVRGVGAGVAQYTKKRLGPLNAAIEQAQRSLEAHGRVIDRLSNELSALRREFDLEKKLEEARNKRRVENLEVALLAAGRNPAEREDVEGDLPDFREWRGQHAQ